MAAAMPSMLGVHAFQQNLLALSGAGGKIRVGVHGTAALAANAATGKGKGNPKAKAKAKARAKAQPAGAGPRGGGGRGKPRPAAAAGAATAKHAAKAGPAAAASVAGRGEHDPDRVECQRALSGLQARAASWPTAAAAAVLKTGHGDRACSAPRGSKRAREGNVAASPAAAGQARPKVQDEALDGAWMVRLFPDKDEAKRAEWLRVLQISGCATPHDLIQLDAERWRELGAPALPPP